MGEVIRRVKNGKFIGYYLRWYEGGKRRIQASKQPTFAEARRMLQAIEGRIARGLAGLDDPEKQPDLTVEELCRKFLSEFASPRVKDMDRYRHAARYSLTRLLPLVGKVPRPRAGAQCAVTSLPSQHSAGLDTSSFNRAFVGCQRRLARAQPCTQAGATAPGALPRTLDGR